LVPEPINNRLWHIPFNRVNDDLTEQLVRGREDTFYGYEFAIQGGKKLPDYPSGTTSVSSPTPTSTLAQNEQRKSRPLTMPVLAIGGAESWGEAVADGIKPAADDVQTVVIPGAGHWVAEQAPQEVLAVLTEFLAPYRDGPASRPDPQGEGKLKVTVRGTLIVWELAPGVLPDGLRAHPRRRWPRARSAAICAGGRQS
jgi:hypothetical protein